MGGEKIRNIVVYVAGTDEEYQGSLLGGIREAAVEFGFNVSVFACFGGVLAKCGTDPECRIARIDFDEIARIRAELPTFLHPRRDLYPVAE